MILLVAIITHNSGNILSVSTSYSEGLQIQAPGVAMRNLILSYDITSGLHCVSAASQMPFVFSCFFSS